jgi:uncharacterized protein YgiB involved in biofilm formation
MLRRFRKSGRVTLVLMGVAALAGCGGDDTRRDVYKSRQDCLADWANKPEDCQPATQQRHAGMGYFYGPWYMYRSGGSGSAWTSGARGSHAIGSTSSGSVSRGGFGATGHSSAG